MRGNAVVEEARKLQPAQPKPLVMREDPAVEEARKRQRLAARRRKGRRSTIVTGGAGVQGLAPLSRPQALGS